MLLLIFFPFLILLTLAQFAQFDVLPVLMGAYYEPPEDDEHLSDSIAGEEYGAMDHGFSGNATPGGGASLDKGNGVDDQGMTKDQRERAINDSLLHASQNSGIVSNCAHTLFNLIERSSHRTLAVQNEEAVVMIIALSRSKISTAKVLCGAILCRLALEPQCCQSFVQARPNAPPLLQVRV